MLEDKQKSETYGTTISKGPKQLFMSWTQVTLKDLKKQKKAYIILCKVANLKIFLYLFFQINKT